MNHSKHNTKETPILTARNIVKNFEQGGVVTRVLRGIDLDVYPGEFIAIMGKSGAGKSTLLYQLSLLDTPTSGTVAFHGTHHPSMLPGIDDKNGYSGVVSDMSEQDKTIFRLHHYGFVFQDYALFPELTAGENITLPLMMRGMSHDDAYIRAQQVLRSLSLTEQIDKLPSRMSGGQQQRISIARAIAGHPDILFADEPTANLDSVSSGEVMELFEQEYKNGRTIIMVTHEPEYAELASRVIHISDGVIVSDRKHRG